MISRSSASAAFGVFVRKQILVGQSDHLRRILPAMPLGQSPADRDEAAVKVLEIDSLRQVFHQGGQQIALLRQRQLGLPTLGDVPGHADDPLDLSCRIAVHLGTNPDHMLALVGRPRDLEFGVHTSTRRNRPRKFCANPLAILFMDQLEEVLVAALERFAASPKRACMRSSHHIESAGRSQSQVPISAELNARFSRSCSLLTRAFLMREWGRRLFSMILCPKPESRANSQVSPPFSGPPWMRNRARFHTAHPADAPPSRRA